MATAETVYRQFQRNQEILPLQLNSFVGFLNSLGHDQVFSFLTTNNTRSEISQIVRRVILMSLVQHNNVIKLTPKTKHIPSFALFHRLPGEENWPSWHQQHNQWLMSLKLILFKLILAHGIL
jgi:hypothetical protein